MSQYFTRTTQYLPHNSELFIKMFYIIENTSNFGASTQISLIMGKNEFKSAKQYAAPDIEVVEIELTQNILQGSDKGNAPSNFSGEEW